MQTIKPVLMVTLLLVLFQGMASAQSLTPILNVRISAAGNEDFQDHIKEIHHDLGLIYEALGSPFDQDLQWRLTFDPAPKSSVYLEMKAAILASSKGEPVPVFMSAETTFSMSARVEDVVKEIVDQMVAMQKQFKKDLTEPIEPVVEKKVPAEEKPAEALPEPVSKNN